jgi:cysteinyl-tRNA synthetase
MSKKHLGQPFDIHGGAMDLRFPHHENEIAQSEATYGTEFVKYWMHAGLLKVEGEKMSNSLGNFIEIPDVLDKYDPMVLRYWRATVHYRSEINYSEKLIDSAKSALGRLRDAVRNMKSAGGKGQVIGKYHDRFVRALEDDFNTPEAVAVLWEVVKDREEADEDRLATILDFDRVLGLRLDEIDPVEDKIDGETKSKVERLVVEREEARKNGDWGDADRIRKELSELNVEVEDTPDGPVWKVV